MALDLAPYGIRVNAIAPGPIAVERRTSVGSENSTTPYDYIPLGRLGCPEDIAGAASFLVSDDAAFITGAILFVDGGFISQLRPQMIDEPVESNFVKEKDSNEWKTEY
jgi:3-oxoacyl-[acyl-carrier protein] reductase